MKKIYTALCLVSAFTVAGCTPGNNVPGSTAAGAVAGGVIGSTLFHGSTKTAAVVGSALVGAIAGNAYGNKMDEYDKLRMQQAIVNTPPNHAAVWTNQKTNAQYRVVPVRSYQTNGDYCREYQTTVTINGKAEKSYGTACRKPDGTWQIVK